MNGNTKPATRSTATKGVLPKNRPAALLAAVGFLAAVGLPVACLVVGGIQTDTPWGVVPIAVTILVLASTKLASLLHTGELRIVTAVFWMMIYISGAVVPLAQAHVGLWPVTVTLNTLPYALMIILVWAVSFDTGQRLRLSKKPLGGLLTESGTIHLGRLKVLTAIGSLATLAYIANAGLGSFFGSRVDLSTAIAETGLAGANGSQVNRALFGMVATVPVFIAWVTWSVLMRRNREVRTVTNWAQWSLLTSLNLVVNNPISNSRYWSLAVIIGFLFAMPGFSSRRLRIIIPLGIIAAIVLFPYADYFRNDQGSIKVEGIAQKISSKDYDQSTMTANGIWYVKSHSHTHGRQLLGAVLFAVPREAWPNKPLDTGVLIGQAASTQIDVGTTNLSSPAWVELWIDFGMLGVVIGGGVAGIYARRADETFMAGNLANRTTVMGVVLPVVAGFTFILLRGPLLQAMSRVAVITAVALWVRRPKTLTRLDPETSETETAEGRPVGALATAASSAS